MINVPSYDIQETAEPGPGSINTFEKHYISIRKKEQRIYSDDELALLPDISPGHIHYKEWLVRKRSVGRLVSYLTKKNKPLNILEVGCGNGWLSAKLAEIDNARVTGLDINLTELKQAFKVFDKPNLSFVYGDIHDKLISGKFDIIVFAACIQYFPSPEEIITTSISLLKEGGEIHILDTHFYEENELNNAIERTKNYYAAYDAPEMAAHYFHHRVTSLKDFECTILSRANSMLNKLLRIADPFPWIRITKK